MAAFEACYGAQRTLLIRELAGTSPNEIQAELNQLTARRFVSDDFHNCLKTPTASDRPALEGVRSMRAIARGPL